jgi:hypothetical protein
LVANSKGFDKDDLRNVFCIVDRAKDSVRDAKNSFGVPLDNRIPVMWGNLCHRDSVERTIALYLLESRSKWPAITEKKSADASRMGWSLKARATSCEQAP